MKGGKQGREANKSALLHLNGFPCFRRRIHLSLSPGQESRQTKITLLTMPRSRELKTKYDITCQISRGSPSDPNHQGPPRRSLFSQQMKCTETRRLVRSVFYAIGVLRTEVNPRSHRVMGTTTRRLGESMVRRETGD